MLAYTIRRLLLAIPTLLGISLITFLLVRVSGDPARFVLGDTATPEAIAAFRHDNGLDKPIAEQFLVYNANVLRGDFGDSLRYKEPVLDLFLERVVATLQLGVSAYVVAVVLGVSLGVFSAVRAGSLADKLVRILVLLGQAVPGFYLGLVLIILVSVRLGWFPTGGRGGPSHFVLPTITLSSYLIAVIVRFTRSVMLDVLHNDYVRTARAKGLTDRVVVWRHALPNALIPLLTILALQSSVVFSGAVVTETVFSWPGIGRFAVAAIQTRDYPVVQGTVLILTTFVVLLNILVDLAYAFLDPRIKYS
jgi:ABC-type dipeptide/oligopeptide/nickel transport system permease component